MPGTIGTPRGPPRSTELSAAPSRHLKTEPSEPAMAPGHDGLSAPAGVPTTSSTPIDPIVVIRTLGRAEAFIDPAPSSGDHVLVRGKPLALLAWLATTHNRTCTRDQAIDLI